jgi:hypothetical protein
MSSFQQQKSQDDIIDIQDKIGYVDTGPTLQQQQPVKNTVVSSSTSHLTIKEPRPQSQVHILLNKHHHPSKPSETQQENKVSFHSTTKPIIKKSNSIENITSSSSTTATIANPMNGSQPPRTIKGKERQTPLTAAKGPDTSPVEYTGQNRDEIKDMMVSKLYELADMLKSLNIDEQRSSQVIPRLTPSKSDPAYSYPYQYQPALPRKPIKTRYIPHHPQYPSPPDHQHRQSYNKSADPAMNYQEPTTVRNHRSSTAYPTTRYADAYYNTPYYPPHLPPAQTEEDLYDAYYYDPEDSYDMENTSRNYYMVPPPLPPPQPYYDRPRRKSFGHFPEGSLHRKSSRGNLRRSRQPVMFDGHYEPYPHQQAYPPAYYPHQYSPNDSYYP